MEKNQITLKDLRKAVKLVKQKEKLIKVCADCFIEERIWIKDHSKCSGN